MKSERNGTRGARRVAHEVSNFWHDLLTLGELQGRLFASELAELVRRTRNGFLLIVAGVIVALGSVPVVLAAVALGLRAALDLTFAAAFALTALVALAGCAGLLIWGWRSLCRDEVLPRSRGELHRNLHWLKDAVRRPSTGQRHAEPSECEFD